MSLIEDYNIAENNFSNANHAIEKLFRDILKCREELYPNNSEYKVKRICGETWENRILFDIYYNSYNEDYGAKGIEFTTKSEYLEYYTIFVPESWIILYETDMPKFVETVNQYFIKIEEEKINKEKTEREVKLNIAIIKFAEKVDSLRIEYGSEFVDKAIERILNESKK